MRPVDKLLGRLEQPRANGDGWRCRCPVHDGKSPDSLSISETDDGGVLVHCFAGCGATAVVEAVGLSMSDLYPPAPDIAWRDATQLAAMRAPHAGTARMLRDADRRLARERQQSTATVVELDLAEPRPDLPDLSEFLAAEFPARERLLGPIQTAHVVHVSGAAGVGKTMVAVAWSLAIGTSGRWCHWAEAEGAPRTVLHVDGELPPGELQSRFRAQGATGTERVVPLSAIWLAEQGCTHVNLALPDHQSLVEHYLERYGATVLQLDNVMSLVYVAGVSMSSDEFWRPVAAWLRRLRGKGITSIAWDHTNAAGLTFGTKTKEWQSDLAIQLTRQDDYEPDTGCRFDMAFGKVRGAHSSDVHGVAVTFENGVWEAVNSVNRDRERAQEMKRDGMTVRDIACSLNRSLGWVSKNTKKSTLSTRYGK